MAPLLVILAALAGITVVEMIANSRVKAVPSAEEKASGNFNSILATLASGGTPADGDWRVVDAMAATIRGRCDTSDFAFQTALRVLLTPEYRAKVPPERVGQLREAFTGYRFWLAQPGNDGMCQWSENHQILGATDEYLPAILWPEDSFANDGLPASEHKAMAASRINSWLSLRWRYGFSEWDSPTYYVEDISPLSLLADFADDAAIRTRSAIILDLILYDLSSGNLGGFLNASSGRSYERAKKGSDADSLGQGEPLVVYNSLACVMEELKGGAAGADVYGLSRGAEGAVALKPGSGNGMTYNFVYRESYRIPPVLRAIANDAEPRVIMASQGLRLGELKAEGLLGQSDEAIMAQWGMEAFTNPEVIANSMRYMGAHRLFGNEMLHAFSSINLGILKYTGLLPLVSRIARPVTNGKAIERANTYELRTGRYLLATAQDYPEGGFGDQQHLWTASFGPFAVFTTHPMSSDYDSAGFWEGNGSSPALAQDGEVVLAIYEIPARRGLMQREVVPFTHAYFPVALFDEVDESRLASGLVFGTRRGAFIALESGCPLEFVGRDGARDNGRGRNNLVARGRETYWICEMGDSGRESFEAFKARVSTNAKSFGSRTLRYSSRGRDYELGYGRGFSVNGAATDLEYPRFAGPYVEAPRKPRCLDFSFGGKRLHLDFEACERKFD